MQIGQKVRFRPKSSVARDWRIPEEAQGTVTCVYRLLKEHQPAPNRVDVRFGSRLVVWAAPEEAFEPVAESD